MNNPWKLETWNVTEQGRYLTEHGLQAARSAASAAGLDPDTQPGLRLDGSAPPARPLPVDRPQVTNYGAYMQGQLRRRPYHGVLFGRDPRK